MKHSQELKRKLGIGVWKELQNDLQQSIKNVQETTAYVIDKFYHVVGGFKNRPLSLSFSKQTVLANPTNDNYQTIDNSQTSTNSFATTSSGLGLFNSPYVYTSDYLFTYTKL